MKKYERLASAASPDGTRLELFRHDGAYVIRADGAELMSTRRHASEEQLAELACATLHDQPHARVLIGGLGFGFTLRAALRALPADAQVVVVEIIGAVIEWNMNGDYELATDALADSRVEVRQEDVTDSLRDTADGFDAIILDVDNGAEAITSEGNAALYTDQGIRLTRAALRPNGRVAYWAAERDARFEASLRRAGLTVEATQSRAYATSERLHTLYVAHVARRPTATPDLPASADVPA